MAIPRPTEFLLATPLYLVVPYDGAETWQVLDLLYFAGTYDSYCTKCQRESTFQVLGKERPGHLHRNEKRERLDRQHGVEPTHPSIDAGVYLLDAQCTRVGAHRQRAEGRAQ